MGADEVEQAVAASQAFLSELTDRDWTVGVPDLDMTVAGVVAHFAEACMWYSIDLSARGVDLPTVEVTVKPDNTPTDLLATVTAYSRVLASVLRSAPSDARGFHPFGTADPSGFAAMACDEILMHTDDAARGLGATFEPPAELASAVVGRLFPWVQAHGLFGDDDHSPWTVLRWANGRRPLGDYARLERWRWHCEPLDDWYGNLPDFVSSASLDGPD